MAYSFDAVAPLYDLVMPRRRPDEFLALLDAGTDDAILEVGAGTGRIAQHYAARAGQCVLVDPSARMLQRARRKAPEARHVVGSVESLEFPDDSFDKIVCFDSLHHWADQARGLSEVRRVLKPDGLLVMVEVDPTRFWGHKVVLFEKVVFEKLLGMQSRFHPPESLLGLVRSAGFRNAAVRSVGDGFTYGLVCTK
jgi:ubiquinone/menaquinone biosynthesis C-methylase UbiE